MHTNFVSFFKDSLQSKTDVSRLMARRSATLFTQGEKAESVYFIEEGLIKLTRTNAEGGRLITSICGPGDVVGEESLTGNETGHHCEAEALNFCTVYKVPVGTMRKVMIANPELTVSLVHLLLKAQLRYAARVELHCLSDAESRILFHLDELAKLVKPNEDDYGHSVPITQLEFSDLVGSTRETISTTLNQLEKKGLVKLSRRLLTIYPQQSAGEASAATA